MSSNITKGALLSYVSIFLNIGIGFLYTPWMIQQVGKSDYALYSLVGAFLSYFILDFGLNTSTARFVAKYRADGNEEKVSNIIGIISKTYLIIDTIIFVVLAISYFLLDRIFVGLTTNELETLKILYIIAGTFSVLSFVLKPIDGIMLAYEFFIPNKLFDMIHKVGSVLIIVTLLMFHGDIYSLIFVNGATAFIASLFKYIYFKNKTKIQINWNYYDKQLIKSLFSFSVWIFLIGLSQRFRLSFIPSILGIQSNSSEIAIFSLGMTIEGFVWTISSALNGLFLPKVTRMSLNSSDRAKISELLLKVGRIQYFIILAIFSGFCIFGKTFIKLWIGEEFASTYYVVTLLLAPSLINSTQAIASDMVYADNKVKYTSPIILSTSLIGLIASFLLSPKYGAIGCASCTCIALLLYSIFVNVFYKRNLKLNIGNFFKKCHLSITIKTSIPIICGIIINNLFHSDNWLGFGVSIMIYIMIYILNTYFVAFNREEKSIINNIFKIVKRT